MNGRKFETLRRATVLWAAVALLAAQVAGAAVAGADGVDVQVSQTADTGNRTTQSETSLAFGNGVFCAGFNDSGGTAGFSGVARSTDLGANWDERPELNESGDPVIVHHQASDTFYYASLGATSIRVAVSTDGCETFGGAVNASNVITTIGNATTLADKPWIAVDNTGGATDGNLYVCWTRFIDTDNDGASETSELRVARSTDGGTTWGNEQVVAATGTSPFGCHNEVASDGSISLVWADRSTDDIMFLRSTDNGVTYGSSATVNSGAVIHPGDDLITNCSPSGSMRPTLNGNIRMLHQAWMAIDNSGGPNDGNIYVVWGTDPAGATDNSDVLFSVSSDNGANWSTMLQLGAGGGATDQFTPDVAVSDNGDVGVAWLDRRNDTTNNTMVDLYTAFSTNGGSSFGSLVRISDQSFDVPQLNPNFDPGVANCYMGEYISTLAQGGGFYYLWGDNRNTVTNAAWPTGRPDPDVFFDFHPGPSNQAPTVDVDPASGDEGASIVLSGTINDPDGDFLLFSWSVTPNVGVDPGATCILSDENTLNPTVVCSDDGSYTVTLTATGDADGDVQATDTLVVANVAPDVNETSGDATINEGESYTMSATFSDPGWNDTYTGSIDWDFPAELPEATTPGVGTEGPPADLGTISGTRQYMDNGVFTVVARVDDDNGGFGTDSVTVTVNNVDPTAEIDEAGTILINGTPTVLVNAGDPVDFSARSTDPGSDDLTLSWDWDDGPPVPDVTVVSLHDPPNLDGLPSPDGNARDVTDDQTHAFGEACFYEIVFASVDDDGGSASDTLAVVVVGNNDEVRSKGYWTHQYRGNGKTDFDDVELECFLAIVNFVSTVFSEVRSATTIDEAVDVLRTNGSSDMAELLDAQLIAALFNFANGAIGWDELVDTDGDGVDDTAFSTVIMTAETVRANPASTRAELEAQKDILERVNLGN